MAASDDISVMNPMADPGERNLADTEARCDIVVPAPALAHAGDTLLPPPLPL